MPQSARGRPAAPHITPTQGYFDEHPPWVERGQAGLWLRWTRDGRMAEDLAGYHVYRRAHEAACPQWLGFTTSCAFALPADSSSATYIYIIQPETKDGWVWSPLSCASITV